MGKFKIRKPPKKTYVQIFVVSSYTNITRKVHQKSKGLKNKSRGKKGKNSKTNKKTTAGITSAAIKSTLIPEHIQKARAVLDEQACQDYVNRWGAPPQFRELVAPDIDLESTSMALLESPKYEDLSSS